MLREKRGKPDIQEFGLHLMDNLFSLRRGLINRTYRHGGYQTFNISDPKPRNIHKASVRDHLLHHAMYRVLYPYFDRKFIADSFSCRIGRGTHKVMNCFRRFGWKASRNDTRTCWILKCDIRKFFTSIDQAVLIDILRNRISEEPVLWLLGKIISSFSSARAGIGLPLGNLTSQLFVNVYINEFDQFMKHKLRVKYYIRYTDDFIIFSDDRVCLENLILQIDVFLRERLKLILHPQKVSIKTLASGADFLGWVYFPGYRVLRTATKRRMMKRIKANPAQETLDSYLGLLKHGNAVKIRKNILNQNNKN